MEKGKRDAEEKEEEDTGRNSGENLIKKFFVVSATTAEVNKASRQPTGKTTIYWRKELTSEQ